MSVSELAYLEKGRKINMLTPEEFKHIFEVQCISDDEVQRLLTENRREKLVEIAKTNKFSSNPMMIYFEAIENNFMFCYAGLKVKPSKLVPFMDDACGIIETLLN